MQGQLQPGVCGEALEVTWRDGGRAHLRGSRVLMLMLMAGVGVGWGVADRRGEILGPGGPWRP
jgi:hypothetical protein